jgi:hypothetical protein
MKLSAAAARRLAADLEEARVAEAAGRIDRAWALLEEAHILSQPAAWPHVRVHAAMFALAWRRHDRAELRGQLFRLVVAGPGSLTGRYPVGNTGRANVPATQPMPVPAELAPLLPGAR